jgi:hypothetical protein
MQRLSVDRSTFELEAKLVPSFAKVSVHSLGFSFDL